LLLEEAALGRPYPADIRKTRLENIANINRYHQRRNATARHSHQKRRLRQLYEAGVPHNLTGLTEKRRAL
jgi:hypothetical protein